MRKYVLAAIAVGVFLFAVLITSQQTNMENVELKEVIPYKPKAFSKADRIQKAFQQEFFKTFDPKTLSVPRERLKVGVEAIEQYRIKAQKFRKAVTLNWEERGPYNVGGRTKALLWDPNDANNTKVWAGAASGGLWYNDDITDVASEWVAVDDQMATLSVTAIVYDPVDPNTMYIGTGEGHIIGSVRGAGMYKSEDGGVTWTHMIPSNGFFDTESNFHYVNDLLVVDEGGSEGVIYAATQASLNEYTYFGYGLSGENGLWRSTDGGATFTQLLANVSDESYTYPMGDLEIDANGRIWAGTARDIYAAATARIFYSDNGTTWNVAYDPGTGDRVELATAPSNANRVYAVAATGGTVAWMVTTSSATSNPTSWSSITIPTHYDPTSFGGGCGVNCSASGDFTRSSQAFYDLILKVDPSDASKVWVGGIDLHQSTDAGATWDQMTTWYSSGGASCFCLPYVHADQHVLEYNPADNTELLSGHDGGVSYTTDANAVQPSWATHNSRYNVTQFYGGAMHPTSGTNQFLAGAQDNGSQYFSGTGMITTTEASGGDGAYCNIDQDEPQYQWTQYVYNTYYRSTNTGTSFGNQIEFGSSTGRFINPSVYDNAQDIMYAAGDADEFLRWTNPQSGSTGSFASANFGGHVVSALAVSPNVTNRIYFGTGNNGISETGSGNLYYVDGANTGTSETPVEISGTGFPANSYLSGIAIEDGNEDHIVVTFSNYGVASVWETSDGGTTWINIEGNLPDMPVRWVILHPEDPNRVLLATELGVWSTDETAGGSTEWSPHDDEDFPHVRTDMLQVRTSDMEMIAITHGRGLWSTNIALPTTTDPEISFNTTSNVQTESQNATDGCRAYRDYTVQMSIANPPTGAAIVHLTVDGISSAEQGYDFDLTTTDFISPSLQLTFPDGSGLNRSFTIRIYDDEAVETTESFTLSYSITGSTDAIAAADDQTYTFTINDNDSAPVVNSQQVLFSEDFETQTAYADLTNEGWIQITFNGGLANGNQWRFGQANVLNGNNSIYASSGTASVNYSATSSTNVGMVTPVIDATGITNLNLRFDYRCNGELFSGTYYDYGSLYYVIDSDDDGDLLEESFVQFETEIQGVTTTTAYDQALPPALEGQKFALAFHWQNDNSVANNPAFVVDDIEVSGGVSGTAIASTASQDREAYLGPFETVYFYDDVSGDILLSIENLSDWDYGCTNVQIASGGTSSMTVTDVTSEYFPASKTYSITPQSNNATGSYTITLYYSAGELSGWEAATGKTVSELRMIKVDGPLDADVLSDDLNWESQTPTVGSFGTGTTLSTTFNTGFSSFGVGDTEGWDVPLPVQWLSFTVSLEEEEVQVLWETASETNSDYFQVEHSTNGVKFYTLTRVKAAGESAEQRTYSYTHHTPMSGLNYYRLRQVDFDGAFEYTDVRVIDLSHGLANAIQIYPNPAIHTLNIKPRRIGIYQVRLVSVDGKVLISQDKEGASAVDVRHLRRGVYVLQIQQAGKTEERKVTLR